MSDEIRFQIGETVKLKSGGPEMTVADSGGEARIYCQWFSGSKLQGGYFDEDALESVSKDS